MKHYELLCVLRGTLSEDDVPANIENVKDAITKSGGEIKSVNDMGKSRIAYPIKHIRYGYFNLIHFDAEPNMVPEIQGKLRIMNELLRSLITIRSNKAVAEGTGTTIGGVIDEIIPQQKKRDGKKEDRKEDRPENKPTKIEEKEVKDEEVKTVEKEVVEKKEAKEEKIEPKETVVEKKEDKPKETKKKEEKPISMDDIDKKLDEILQSDLDKV